MDQPKIDYSAVAKGTVIAILLGLAIGAAVGFFGFWLAFAGVLSDKTMPVAMVVVFISTSLLPPMAGGYAAARFAERAPTKHGLATGVALLVFYSVWYVFPDSEFGWPEVVNLMLIIPLAWAGSRICAGVCNLE